MEERKKEKKRKKENKKKRKKEKKKKIWINDVKTLEMQRWNKQGQINNAKIQC